MKKKMKFKVDDLVVITDSKEGHLFEIGQKVQIIEVNEKDNDYHAKSLDDPGNTWWIVDCEAELVKN